MAYYKKIIIGIYYLLLGLFLIVLFSMMYLFFYVSLYSLEFFLVLSFLIYSLSTIGSFLFPVIYKNDPDVLKFLTFIKAGFYILLLVLESFYLFVFSPIGLDISLVLLWLAYFLLFSCSIILDFRYLLHHLVDRKISEKYFSSLHIFYFFISFFNFLICYCYIWYYGVLNTSFLNNLSVDMGFILSSFCILGVLINDLENFYKKISHKDPNNSLQIWLGASFGFLRRFYKFLCIPLLLIDLCAFAYLFYLFLLAEFDYSLLLILNLKIICLIWALKTVPKFVKTV